MIAAIGQPTLGETADYEHADTGVRAFPMASTLPHGIGQALFGAPGYLVADVVVAACYLGLLRWLLLIAGCGARTAAVAALMLAGQVAAPLANLFGNQLPSFWGPRLPRPFVTEIYVTAVLALLLALVRWPALRASALVWAMVGAGLALIVQGEPFWAIPLGCAATALLAGSVLRQHTNWRAAACWLAGGLIVGAPFFVQRLCSHPDVARRLGVFPLHLAHLPWPWEFYARSGPWLACLQIISVLLVAMFAWFRWRGQWRGTVAAASAALVVLATAAPWIQVGLTGTAIQLYHYEDILCRCLSLALLGLAVGVTSDWARYWRDRSTFVIVVAAVLMLTRVSLDTVRALQRPATASIAFEHRGPANDGSGYRADFAALAAVLASQPAEVRVLATLDTQVNGWWVGFRTGACALLPDPCFSTLDDQTLERRLMQYVRTLGYDPAAFTALIQEPEVLLYQLGSGKYQSTKAYQFDPRDPGPATGRRFTDPWGLYLPAAEVARLGAAYAAGSATHDRCDLIVCDPAETHRPDPQLFTEIWKNHRFSVWRRSGG